MLKETFSLWKNRYQYNANGLKEMPRTFVQNARKTIPALLYEYKPKHRNCQLRPLKKEELEQPTKLISDVDVNVNVGESKR
jgi:hypothetical protein